MCSMTEDHCSHIRVTQEAASIIRMLKSVANTACSDHADIILQAMCFIRHNCQEQEEEQESSLPECITRYVDA
jgi:hypothetical protein